MTSVSCLGLWLSGSLLLLFLMGNPFSLMSVGEILFCWAMSKLWNDIKSKVGVHISGFPLTVVSVFMLMLLVNILALVPFGYSINTQLSGGFSIGVFLWLTMFLSSFNVKDGFKYFLSALIPSNCPIWLVWLMYPVEVVSYFIGCFTLGLRLMINLIAGKVLASLVSVFVFFSGGLGLTSSRGLNKVLSGGFSVMIAKSEKKNSLGNQLSDGYLTRRGKSSLMGAFYLMSSKLSFVTAYASGVVVMMAEMGASCLQAYIFFLMLCMCSGMHKR